MHRKIKIKSVLGLITALIIGQIAYGQTIKGRLMYGSHGLAKGVKVILVPRTPDTENITASSSFVGADLHQLDRMHAVISYTNNDGRYYFSNVHQGRYILKVCYRSGTVYKFTVPSTYQILQIRDLSVSPQL